MTNSLYKPFLLQPILQLLSPPAASSNYIVKVMKPLYDVQEASITRFAIYHPHYKDKLSHPTWNFVFATDNLHSVCSLGNLSMAAAEPGLVMKKRELSKTSSHLLSHSFQSLSFFLSLMLSEYAVISKQQSSLTLSKMHLAIPKCPTIFKAAAMSKYNTLFKWEFNSILASSLY